LSRHPLPPLAVLGLLLIIGGGLTGALRADSWDDSDEIRFFRFRFDEGALGVAYELNDDERRSSGNLDFFLHNRDWVYFLDLDGQAAVYHPKFLEIDVKGRFSIHQDHTERRQDSASENLYNPQYSIRARLLKDHPYSLEVFDTRRVDSVLYDFVDRVFVDSESRGATFFLRRENFPLRLSYLSNKVLGTNADREYYNYRNRFATVDLSPVHIGASESDFRFQHREYFDHVRDTRYFHNDLYATNRWHIGGDDRKELLSRLMVNSQTGSFNRDLLDWNERFQWRHTPAFRTFCSAGFRRVEVDEFRSDVVNGGFGFLHDLYESLTTTFRGDLFREKRAPAESLRQQYTLAFTYRKKVPGGRLGAGYQLAYYRLNQDSTGGSGVIIGETVRFDGFLPVVLRFAQALPESVVVYEADSGFVFDEGFDYEIILAEGRLLLARLPGSRIPPDRPVLVDYQYLLSPEYLNVTWSSGANVQYTWRNLVTVYYRRSRLDQSISAETAPPPEMDIDSDTAGARLRWRFFTASFEAQDYESTPLSYTQTRADAGVSFNWWRQFRFGINGFVMNLNYRSDFESRRYRGGNARVEWLAGRDLRLFGDGYLYHDRFADNDRRSWLARAGLQYRLRSFVLQADYSYGHRVFNDVLDFSRYFAVSLRRTF